ncbi:MAG TPA: DUF1824 family protein [Leptolyngbyaceae cyanobacterium]
MTTQNSTNLTVEQALKLLQKFSCIEVETIASASEKSLLQEALQLITSLCDYQNLGICAETVTQGFTILESYLKGLDYQIPFDTSNIPAIEGPVYIKFNTNKQSYYLDSYTGKYRGVLVSCQSSVNESISGTYGHFPLDLFL